MTIPFRYGQQKIDLRFRDRIKLIEHREPELATSPALFMEELEAAIADDQLQGSVGIVVADKTRRCQYPLFLPVLTSFLINRGISPSNISFFIAYGTHAAQTDEESLECYGDAYKEFRFIQHNSNKGADLVKLGTTIAGTEVRLSAEALSCDLLISFGAILHHYFAGFGGGRKLFFPGLGGYESILHNHSLFIDYERACTQPGCQSGKLDGNPLAEDLAEIRSMLPPHLEIHSILNSKKEVCEISIGNNEADFRKVCKRYATFFSTNKKEQYDLVVASAGGSPRDLNLIQAHKALHHAASFVRDGGRLILLAACEQGVGNPEWASLFSLGGRGPLVQQLHSNYRNNGGTAVSLMEKSERIDIFMLTEMNQDLCLQLGMEKLSEEKLHRLLRDFNGSIAAIPQAALIYREP